MQTVLTPLNAALDAIDAEIARMTETRNDLASLIEQVRGGDAVPDRPVPSPAPGQAARSRTAPRQLEAVKKAPPKPPATRPNQHTSRRARSPRPCPVPGCDKVCADGTGLASHLRGAHPAFVADAPPRPAQASSSAITDAEQDLADL